MFEGTIGERSIEELLAMVLRSAGPVGSVLEKAGGLEELARAEPFEIAAHLEGRDLDAPADGRRNSGQRRRRNRLDEGASLAAAFELGRRIEIARAKPPPKLTSAAAVAAWAAPRLTALRHEELWMLALDVRGQLRAARCIAKGGLHGASVHAAHPIRAALRVDASAFVLVHNHPSGDPTPSNEDVTLTAHVGAAARITGLPLLDHVVVAREGFACVPWSADAPKEVRTT